ncbi:MAG: precorrin-3B C(17)-methyltransferase [Lentisphaeraceae bacterium]|nr:precorrin-3B C(17)-methyltransferase [Lentisphaeraceae bacterium]
MSEKEKYGVLSVVGIGPGDDGNITPNALAAIAEADMVVGYTTYIKLVRHLVKDKQVIKTGMTEEIGRAKAAIEEAQKGKKVTLISSGDAGVYGMCGLVFQVLKEIGWTREKNPELRIIPGVSAINSCASLVGAPLGHDFCAISLSDLLTPWPSIRKKLDCAADADFIIGLYNPASGRRTKQIVEAKEIISKYRPGDTPVALVKSAYRQQQNIVMTDLDNFLDFEIGMNTTVLVGSTQTIMFDGFMVTPRGYTNKYTWDGEVLEGQTPARSLVVEDPEMTVDDQMKMEALMKEKRKEQRRLKREKREQGKL